jgi:hypothetical protein
MRAGRPLKTCYLNTTVLRASRSRKYALTLAGASPQSQPRRRRAKWEVYAPSLRGVYPTAPAGRMLATSGTCSARQMLRHLCLPAVSI